MNAPTRITLATVPRPTLAPSAHAIPSTTEPTQMLATPNESGECLAIPWWSVSQGESPSFDSSWQTIASAKRNSPKISAAPRATRPPRTRGGVCTGLR